MDLWERRRVVGSGVKMVGGELYYEKTERRREAGEAGEAEEAVEAGEAGEAFCV